MDRKATNLSVNALCSELLVIMSVKMSTNKVDGGVEVEIESCGSLL